MTVSTPETVRLLARSARIRLSLPRLRLIDETVVVTAGASAPEQVVQECLSFLRDRFGAQILHLNVLPCLL